MELEVEDDCEGGDEGCGRGGDVGGGDRDIGGDRAGVVGCVEDDVQSVDPLSDVATA